MGKNNKKKFCFIICTAIVLSFGQSVLSDNDINKTQNAYLGYENLSVNTNVLNEQQSALYSNENNKSSLSDNRQNSKSDLLNENGELKETVIADNEYEYYDNDNRIVIEYRNGVKEPEELIRYAGKEKDVNELIKVYKIKSKKYTKKVIDIVKKNSAGIQAAQPDYKMKIASQNTDTYENNIKVKANETQDYYSEGSQWALKNDGTFTNPDKTSKDANIKAVKDVDLNAQGAWEAINEASDVISQNEKSVVVAIVDTGIDYTHDELKNVIWQNNDETKDGSDSDGNGFADDTMGWDFTEESSNDPYDNNGHGTAIAGLIAAANDSKGVVGIASDIDIKIMPVKALDSDGEAYMSMLIEGIEYANNNGADICNCSWGGKTGIWQILDCAIMKQIIFKSDMLFTVAAGNESTDIDKVTYVPASFDSDNLISVGSIEWDGSFSWFSNYGTDCVQLCAPGAAIYTTNTGGGYTCEWGTSFSAPYVAGVAALAKAAAGNISGTELKEIICNTDNMKIYSNLVSYVKYAGIPDAEKVVKAALLFREGNKAISASASPVPTHKPEVLSTASPSSEDLESTENSSSEPVLTDAPLITKTPNGTETPIATQTPVATQTPTETEIPVVTQTPSATETPIATQTPTATKNPLSVTDGIKISSSSTVYKTYMKKINVQISGKVSAVKYSEGKKEASYFGNEDNGFIYVNNKKFTIYALKPGWYTVYVKATDGSEYTKKIFATVKIVKISKTKLKLNKGKKYKLTAELKDRKKYSGKLAAKIYFKTSNKKVVSVNKNTGRIKVKAKGKAVITAYTKNGKSAKCTVIGKE